MSGVTTVQCTYPGCSETGGIQYDNQREAAENAQRSKTWRCTRHVNDGLDVLTLDRTTIEKTLVVVAKPYGKFWQDEDEKLSSGLAMGPGFKAWARDFPEETLLQVVADIFLPPEPKETRP